METPRLQLSHRFEQGIPVVDVDGEIDVYTVPKFKEHLSQIIEEGHTHLLINLNNVQYMDSSGFGALLGATKRLRPEGGTLGLVGSNQVITRMLKITRLNTIFDMFDSENEAIQSFTEGKSPDSASKPS